MTTKQTIDGVPRHKFHNLKIHAVPFEDLVSGAKTAEVRKCDDRDFQVGDSVELFLVDHTGGNATRSIVREITHIQRGYGLPDDLCVLSYAPAAQPQGEPVTWGEWEKLARLAAYYLSPAIVSHQWNMTDETRKEAIGVCRAINNRKPAPVAVVLPERMSLTSSDGSETYETKAWNACIDEVTRLNAKH